MKKYCVLGNDQRNLKLKELYKESSNILVSNYKDADVIIGPTPFSKDNIKINGDTLKCDDLMDVMENTDKVLYAGSISNVIREKLSSKGINYVDLLDSEDLAILNAIPTAEGAIQGAMEATQITIHSSNVLVLGYGRIGKVLAKMLNAIGANVYCEARKKKDIAMIKAMGYNSVELENTYKVIPKIDIIFNTIPHMVLDSKIIDILKKDVCIIDLASAPGGVDFAYAKEKNINVKWLLALPAKVAPITAAKYYKDIIDSLEEGG